MIVRVECQDQDLRDKIIKSVKQLYSSRIRKPIYISFHERFTLTSGMWQFKSLSEYKRYPKQFSPKDIGVIKKYHNGLFHMITLSRSDFKRGVKSRSLDWKWEYYFTNHQLECYPSLCWLSQTLCHELRHAWQGDKNNEENGLTYRYAFSRLPKRHDKVLGITYTTICEYDADIHALQNCKKMLKLLKKGY